MSLEEEDVLVSQLTTTLLASSQTTGNGSMTSDELRPPAVRCVVAAAELVWSNLDKIELVAAVILRRIGSSIAERHASVRQAWWCLLDYLLKHAAPVCLPFVADRLAGLIMDTIAPFADEEEGSRQRDDNNAKDAERRQRAVDAVRWYERLVLSWKGIVPEAPSSEKKKSLADRVADKRARCELRMVVPILPQDADARKPATAQDLAMLQEKLDLLRNTILSMVAAHRRDQVINGLQTATFTTLTSGAESSKASQDAAVAVNGEGDDDDELYEPEFVAGGSQKERPAAALIERVPRKRARPATAPQDDDY